MPRPAGCSRTLLWAIAVVVLGAAAVGTVVLLRPRGVVAELATAHVGPLLVTVRCEGTLEPPRGGELRSEEDGIVAELAVHDGDRVHRGELLLRLANPALEGQAREARAEQLRLEAEDSSAGAAAETAHRRVEHWERVVNADRRLLEQGATTASELRADEITLDEARGKNVAAQSQLASLQGTHARLPLARSSADALARRVSALEIRATTDGIVYGLPRREGERVAPGDLVASIADPDRPRVRLRVDEPDLPQVTVGQRVVVTFSGLPEKQWTGRVVSVTNALREAGDRQVGEVLGEIADPAHDLPLNASVDAQIVVAEKTSALTIPRAALYRQGDRRYVYVLRAGTARRRDVTVGLVGLADVEITSGLQTGEDVLMAGEVPLSEGLRVSPVP
jgi:HlyD family secretion protein